MPKDPQFNPINITFENQTIMKPIPENMIAMIYTFNVTNQSLSSFQASLYKLWLHSAETDLIQQLITIIKVHTKSEHMMIRWLHPNFMNPSNSIIPATKPEAHNNDPGPLPT